MRQREKVRPFLGTLPPRPELVQGPPGHPTGEPSIDISLFPNSGNTAEDQLSMSRFHFSKLARSTEAAGSLHSTLTLDSLQQLPELPSVDLTFCAHGALWGTMKDSCEYSRGWTGV